MRIPANELLRKLDKCSESPLYTHGLCCAALFAFGYIVFLGGFLLFLTYHDDVIKWKHFPRYWPFVRGIHRSPVNSPHKGQWRGALMFSLICAWINAWVNNREAGDLRRYRAHCDVTVMIIQGWYTVTEGKIYPIQWISIKRLKIFVFNNLRQTATKPERVHDLWHVLYTVYSRWWNTSSISLATSLFVFEFLW